MQRHAHEQIEHTQVGKMTPMNSHTDAPKIPIQMQNACVHTEPCTYMLTHVYTHGIYLTHAQHKCGKKKGHKIGKLTNTN